MLWRSEGEIPQNARHGVNWPQPARAYIRGTL
jgi:hypothetical protein